MPQGLGAIPVSHQALWVLFGGAAPGKSHGRVTAPRVPWGSSAGRTFSWSPHKWARGREGAGDEQSWAPTNNGAVQLCTGYKKHRLGKTNIS